MSAMTIVETAPKRLLIVSVTKGYRHESIPVAETVITDLGGRGGYTVDYARTDEALAAKLSVEGLSAYDGVFFANTTGDLPLPDPQAFVDWVHAGHAFLGAHSAADTFHGFAPYLEMLGAEFQWHGAQVGVTCHVADAYFPGMTEGSFDIPIEEMYVLQKFRGDQVHLLLYLDKHPNEGTPGLYPLAWARAWGEGRVYYNALGHRDDVWTAPWFQDELLGGIRYALGLAPADDRPAPLPEIAPAEESA